ncbi:hypothetical protein [Mycolicibacterium komossense]|uniref:Uncharacterized protein n=1 Tax=Mycolicibacterium komossense TaxID=1779 RepID=A0ABT3C7L8_9MYCO|nr:hypothetical protein [Mycolicibacterium komossense]MCV7225479.1 hypothetical protein [Mycolicibacterium komossense]
MATVPSVPADEVGVPPLTVVVLAAIRDDFETVPRAAGIATTVDDGTLSAEVADPAAGLGLLKVAPLRLLEVCLPLADGEADVVDEAPCDPVEAEAAPAPTSIAVPIPNAIAKPPTRPMLRAAPTASSI